MKPKIGFIGVGIMGYHMSQHLMKAGYQVIAYDRIKAATDRIVALGADEGLSSKDVAARTWSSPCCPIRPTSKRSRPDGS